MFTRLCNGSTWQIVGSDNYGSLVGTPPAGIVFSEWPLANPASWAYLAPIVVENNGWALFITTPTGRNHAHAMLEMARADPTWFAELLTVNGDEVDQPRKRPSSSARNIIRFSGSMPATLLLNRNISAPRGRDLGAHYARELTAAKNDGRIK
jgi:phage terminase large subunit